MSVNRLEIYLNDHLAGAAGGVALARRVAGSHDGDASEGDLQRLAREIAEDRDVLVGIVKRLGLRRTFYKEPLALAAERLGRFKPNGSIVSRSPMSDVVEFEALTLGITGKRSGWLSLRQIVDHTPELDAAELDTLIARADEQLELVERLRRDAAQHAFAAA